MAKIPMGNFGQAMPEVQRINLPQDQRGQMIAGALQNVSQVAEKKDQQIREAEVSAKRLELYLNDLDKRDAQLKVDDVLSTDFSNKVAELKNSVGNGSMTADTANNDLKIWSDDRFSQLQGELPGHAMPDFQNQWNSTINRQSGAFLPLQIKATEQKEMVLSDRAFDIATRLSRGEGREYLATQLGSANIPESRKQQLKMEYETVRDKVELDSGIEDAFSTGDIAALKQVQSSIKEKTHIDGPTAQRYSASISSKIATLQQRAEIIENKRINEAGKVFNNFKQQVMTGSGLGEELLNNTAIAVKGTEYEAEYNFYLQQSKNFQTFADLSTSEQLKTINNFKAQQKNSKSNDPETENKILSVYENIHQDKLKAVRDNPTQALREKGIDLPELNAAELKISPDKFIDSLSQIGAYQVAQRDKDGNATVKPISPDVLPEAKATFDSMGVNDKLNFIGNLIGKNKNVKSGQAIWAATLGQLGGGDLSYVMAGVAKNNGYRSEQGVDVASAIISGTQALKNKALIMPGDDLLRQEFNKHVGSSVSGETANMNFAAYKSIYAHLSEQSNYTHKDQKDLNKSLSSAALSLTTGGVYDQKKYGGQQWKVSKPYGMPDDRFSAIMDTRYQAIANKYKVNQGDIEDLRIRREAVKGPNGVIRYALIDERGKPMYYVDMPPGVTK